MMATPDVAVLFVSFAEESHAHQWRLPKLESTIPLAAQPLLKSFVALSLVLITPIFLRDLDRSLGPDNLYRAFGTFPFEGSPQRIVPGDNRIPRRGKGRHIELALYSRDDLVAVDARIGRVQRVEQHSLLHRSQRVDILYFAFSRESFKGLGADADQIEAAGSVGR